MTSTLHAALEAQIAKLAAENARLRSTLANAANDLATIGVTADPASVRKYAQASEERARAALYPPAA